MANTPASYSMLLLTWFWVSIKPCVFDKPAYNKTWLWLSAHIEMVCLACNHRCSWKIIAKIFLVLMIRASKIFTMYTHTHAHRSAIWTQTHIDWLFSNMDTHAHTDCSAIWTHIHTLTAQVTWKFNPSTTILHSQIIKSYTLRRLLNNFLLQIFRKFNKIIIWWTLLVVIKVSQIRTINLTHNHLIEKRWSSATTKTKGYF